MSRTRGKVIVDPMPVPGVGEFVMLPDPDGVRMGLFDERSDAIQP